MKDLRSPGRVLLVCVCFLAASSCSMIAAHSEDCDPDDGQTTLQLAGMESEGLTVIESCVRSSTGIRPNENRTVVASGSREAVEAALETGGVDLLEATPSNAGSLRGPESFEVQGTSLGEEWQEGEMLVVRDVVDGQGGPPYRYVAWGKQTDGDQYLLHLRLGTEIL